MLYSWVTLGLFMGEEGGSEKGTSFQLETAGNCVCCFSKVCKGELSSLFHLLLEHELRENGEQRPCVLSLALRLGYYCLGTLWAAGGASRGQSFRAACL